ncbi:MAG: cytochrome c oxidase subunit II [Acidobacteria bacterium]|nr:cytochrome c oxidase subunit II [Acidobacteriota bacterium]
MSELLGLPVQASEHAAEIDNMIVLLHWLMAVLFVGWGAFFIYTLIRFRAKANPKADYTGVTSHTSSYLEITVAVIEAVLLVGFAIPAWASRVNELPPEEEATVVRMIGKQFEWHSHYPGADGRWGRRDLSLITPTNSIGLDRSDPNGADDIVSINQMNLPVDKPVIVYLSSQDVIHSMGIAEMRVKQDAIPGIEIPVWWVPNLIGDFEVNCSQLCGLGHYRMRGFVSIMTQADYDAWLAEEAALIPAN